MTDCVPRIIGYGFALPEQIRTNSDPVFAWLREHNQAGDKLFTGYDQRRVLSHGETVTTIMMAAARRALADAAVAPSSIDLLLGYASVSEYITPNSLAQVHADIGLPASTVVLPLADDFTNFNSGVVLADALIRQGRCRRALIVCGGNWTGYVDYHTPQAISAGDGAGAAVMAASSDPAAFQLVDRETLVATSEYGTMYMQADPVAGPEGQPWWTSPYMHITLAGMEAFVAFGGDRAPTLAATLIDRNDLAPAAVTLICHQASAVLLDTWRKRLAGVTILDTLPAYGNVVLASIPINLATYMSSIGDDWLILLGLGAQLQASALLLRRG